MVPFRPWTRYEKIILYLINKSRNINQPVCFHFLWWSNFTLGKKVLGCSKETYHWCKLYIIFSSHNFLGKLATDSTYLGLKEEVKWVVQLLHSKKMKRIQFLQVLPIKASCLSVIGQEDRQIKQALKMILFLDFGIKKEVLDLLLL